MKKMFWLNKKWGCLMMPVHIPKQNTNHNNFESREWTNGSKELVIVLEGELGGCLVFFGLDSPDR